jgi:hypothetical protein
VDVSARLPRWCRERRTDEAGKDCDLGLALAPGSDQAAKRHTSPIRWE